MNKQLVIIGASGHGKVAADIAKKMDVWEKIIFLDDFSEDKLILDYPIIGKTDLKNNYKNDSDFFVAIGNQKVRRQMIEELFDNKFNITTLIHPSAILDDTVIIDQGSIVMAGVVINSSVSVGKGCIINTSTSIDHDCQIANYVHLSPGVHLAGNVNIGKNTWLGIGSKVINNIDIAEDIIVGAGAVVVLNLHKEGTYKGVPAVLLY